MFISLLKYFKLYKSKNNDIEKIAVYFSFYRLITTLQIDNVNSNKHSILIYNWNF